ncbi:MAG TPA: SpoIIE family protein phosphatase [Terriglobales bacterium]|nr:SpoIIE family protein phosphatase [Terriglobales bacterium]
MPREPRQLPDPGSAGDSIVFVEQGIRHSFQFEGAAPAHDREDVFLRLNFVSVYVRDQERSKNFFVDQLGFRLMIDARFPSGYRWIEVAPPDGTARLALVLPGPGFVPEGVPGRSSLITFTAENVEAKYQEWSARGVKFSLPPHIAEWGAMFCRFEDPDGNPFGLAGFSEVTQALETRRQAEARRREAERLAAREMEIARQVQLRLLPQKPPSIPTLDCAGICVQARAVGGDYYDFLELGGDKVAVVVADIAGKGIAAALQMANLQASLRSQCAWGGGRAEQALANVNRLLFETTDSSAYATLFYAEYDTNSGRLHYANCGHLPGLLLRGDEITKLDAANTVVGLFSGWECTLSEALMQTGDMLVLYTDGVTEAFDGSGEQFGEPRLIGAIRANRDVSAGLLTRTIIGEVADFAAGKQDDDMTVVVVKKIA